MLKAKRWVRAVGAVMTGGILLQFGACSGLLPQIGAGLGFSLGSVPAQAVGCLVVEGIGQTCEGVVVPGAIILGD